MILHDRQHVIRGGAPLARASAALILLHGRGAGAQDIYPLGEEVCGDMPEVALVAPQAAGNEWYPQRFLAPLSQNEPFLTSALGVVANLVAEVSQNRIGQERIVLVGFSQGACLCLEFASRHARRYGGVVGLSGALIGPPGSPRPSPGNLGGTPVYLGCDARDAHIPLPSVRESAQILEAMGGRVTTTIFTGLGHSINAEEIGVLRDLVRKAASTA